MLKFLKKNCNIMSPISGKIMDLKDVPDKVFAEKMAGDGVAIVTYGDMILAPADGIISIIFKSNHAVGMTLNNGVELLIHIGIDTVELEGVGFTRLIEEGKKVKVGDPIIKIDRKFIIEKGYSLITPVLITNTELINGIDVNIGEDVKAGEDILMTYRTK